MDGQSTIELSLAGVVDIATEALFFLAIIVGPSALLVYLCHRDRGSFAGRYGSSAEVGWFRTMVALGAAWPPLTIVLMWIESGRGAHTSAVLLPLFMWPILIVAMLAATFLPIAAYRAMRAWRRF